VQNPKINPVPQRRKSDVEHDAVCCVHVIMFDAINGRVKRIEWLAWGILIASAIKALT